MYALGPLVFWVDAESTCAFFILCMPCLPKILREKGIIRNLKQCLGMRVTQPGGSYGSDLKPGKYVYGSGRHSADDSYRIWNDRGVPLENMGTESTEHLRQPDNVDGKIMRTRHITVQVSDPDPRGHPV